MHYPAYDPGTRSRSGRFLPSEHEVRHLVFYAPGMVTDLLAEAMAACRAAGIPYRDADGERAISHAWLASPAR